MNRRRLMIELILAGLAMLYLCGWSVSTFLAQRDAARRAAAELAECRRLVAQIERLRRAAPVAGEAERKASETAGLLEQAARDAGISPAASLVRIAPESPRRIGETSYREIPTQVVLRQVTLSQLVAMLAKACDDQSGLRSKAIRFTAPRDEADSGTWSAEATLVQLVFSPREQPIQGEAK